MVFCNKEIPNIMKYIDTVTILILIDGFLQYVVVEKEQPAIRCHNPYFNRWFSAIKHQKNTNRISDTSQSLF